MDNKTLAKVVFCARYLYDHLDGDIDEVKKIFDNLDNYATPGFVMVEIDDSFFTELATKLRELWPAGEKDGKYPWRDSVSNLSRRLRTLWTDRNLGQYTIEDCLRVARKYLAQFEDNVKYMKLLKYFILKQGKVVGKDGRIVYTNNSTLADMLENDDTAFWDNEDWNATFTDVTMAGELV